MSKKELKTTSLKKERFAAIGLLLAVSMPVFAGNYGSANNAEISVDAQASATDPNGTIPNHSNRR